MLPRCFAPSLDPDAPAVTLTADESAHLVRVLRLNVGDEVGVFDGRGLEYRATLSRAAKSAVELTLGARVTPVPEPRVAVTIAQALLKADKFDAVVRDVTMLGAAAVRPLVTRFADVPASAIQEGGRTDRWHRVAVASAKQCGRAVVPAVYAPASVNDSLAADRSAVRILMAEPIAGVPVEQADALRRDGPPSSAFLLIGPEGGWAAEELAAARAAGCRLITLGPRTFRADVAALIALAILQHVWGDA